MNKLIVFVFILLLGPAGTAYADENKTSELSDLLLAFMLDSETETNFPDWDFNSHNFVLNWINDKHEDERQAGLFRRNASCYVTVKGYAFRDHKNEDVVYDWGVGLQGDSQKVHSVGMAPASEAFSWSSGTGYFNIEEAVDGTPIRLERIGVAYSDAGRYKIAYRAHAESKQSYILIYTYNSGSGGQNSWLEILYQNLSDKKVMQLIVYDMFFSLPWTNSFFTIIKSIMLYHKHIPPGPFYLLESAMKQDQMGFSR